MSLTDEKPSDQAIRKVIRLWHQNRTFRLFDNMIDMLDYVVEQMTKRGEL